MSNRAPESLYMAGDEQLPDGQLLERYVREGDEAAFAALVQRYGSLVLGVCQRVLRDSHAAEDAFQATFLVLVRKASSLDRRGPIGNWIYTVAYRTAVKARANAARRRVRETRAIPMPTEQIMDSAAWQELRPLLDEEINRLPEKYRAPLVLCYLQGKTNEQAAHELGWPTGSMSRRLAQGRELLRKRLVGRGVVLSGTLLGTLLTSNASAAVPGTLAATTVKAAMVFKGTSVVSSGILSPGVVALAEETLKALVVPKLKIVAGVLMALFPIGMIGAGAVFTWEVLPEIKRATDNFEWRATVCQNVWKLDTSLYDRTSPVNVLAAAPDGVTIAAGGERPDCSIQLWDLPTRRVRKNGFLTGHTDSVTSLAFSPDNRLLASGSQDRSIRLWDLTADDPRSTILGGHDKGVTALAFVPTAENILASAGIDGTIKLWDIVTGRRLATLPGGSGPILALSAAPDSKTLASGALDGSVTIFDIASRKALHRLTGHGDRVTSVCFSPRGKLLASASWDTTVRIWDPVTFQQRAVLMGHSAPVLCLGFSPDGTLLASGSQDQSVRIWHANGGVEWAVLEGPAAKINAITWSREPVRLVAGLSDNSMAVWQTVRRIMDAR
jgi:RNA polymerase sigma factor (sigma-70 family)